MVNFYANDPSSTDVSLEQTQFMIERFPQKWEIRGTAPEIGLYNPGTFEFQFCQLDLTLYRCVGLWNNLFQDAFKSWSSTEGLLVIPELDYRTIPGRKNGFNAYYDRNGLNFFYDTDDIKHKVVYTSESVDISAHECGHACLDAVQPDFFNTLFSEVPAFHEAFGDCSAILTTLTDDNVRKAFSKLRDPLNESNFVSRLAEEMGHAIFSRYGKDRSSEQSLRDAINEFKYKDPKTLPDKGPATTLTREGHSFGRVFVGAFYGSFARIYQELAKEVSEDRALMQAHDSIGQIFASSVLGATVTPFLYRELALGMLNADQRLFQGKYREAINNAFVDKEILSSTAASSLDKNSQSGSAKSLRDIVVPENINEIKSEKFAKHVSDLLGISDSNKLDIDVTKGLRSNSIIVRGRYDKFKKLKIDAAGLPDEIEVYIPSGFAILMDTENKSITSHSHETDTDTITEAHSQLQHLINADKIYIPKGDERINSAKLVANEKPYYLEGNRILRAYFA